MLKSRWSALFYLSLVFFSGAVLGAFAYRLYSVRSVMSGTPERPTPPRRPDPEEIRKNLVSEMRKEVKLDDAQVAELNKIYDQTREEGDILRHKANAEMRGVWETQTAKIKAILRPDQIPLYEQLRSRHEAERKRRAPEGGPPRK